MAPPPTAARKRTRKRKRRQVSSSSESSSSASSSSSSSSSSSESSDSEAKAKAKAKAKANIIPSAAVSSSSSSSSSSSDSSDDEVEANELEAASPPSRSPSPPNAVSLPSFLTQTNEKEEELKHKFRQFWMASLADAFHDDLETIRKESNLNTSKLSLLIDSLASGSDIFTSSSSSSEMQMVLQ